MYPWMNKKLTIYDIFLKVFFSVIAGAFSIGQALPFVNIVAAAVGVMSSIQEIIERKVTIDPYSSKGKKPYSCNGRIEFKDVHFRYPSRPSVKVRQYS